MGSNRINLLFARLLSIGLPAAVLCLGLLVWTGTAADGLASTDEIHFTFDEETETITNYDYYSGPKDVIIPAAIGGTPVTKIGDRAFLDKGLTSVVIPNTVTTIGNEAFKGHDNLGGKLESVVIPDSVTSIGDSAFAFNKLTELELPESITTIGPGAFRSNLLTEITIPNSVASLGNNAFGGNQIVSAVIPSHYTTIAASLFVGNKLQHIMIPSTVATIGSQAFLGNELESIDLPAALKRINDKAFERNQLTEVIIPEGVETIGVASFLQNKLTKATVLGRETAVLSGSFANNQAQSGDLTILGHTGSAAETYAQSGNHTFKPLLGLSETGTYTFVDATVGYSAAVSLPVTVTKNVYGDLHNVQVALSGDTDAFGKIDPALSDLDDANPQTFFTLNPQAGLAIGTYTAIVTVTANEYGIHERFDVQFTVNASSSGDNNGGNDNGNNGGGNDSGNNNEVTNPSTMPSESESGEGVDVLVNGRAEKAGVAVTKQVNGRQTTTVALDEDKLRQRLDAEGTHAIIAIPVETGSEVVVGELNGRMVKNMEAVETAVQIRTEQAVYTVPARQINIDDISRRFGTNVQLQDIKIRIEMASPPGETVQFVEQTASASGLTIVLPPLSFSVTAVYGDRAVEVAKFDAYVERLVAIPEGIDPNRITTGIVIEPDGTIRHVPTKVIVLGGIYYAQINSLTNSIYSVIWNPVTFEDVADHWAKEAVNNMGSRLVVSGTGDAKFSPDREITRAEFTAVIARGLGLGLESGKPVFSDVKETYWHSGVIQAAHNYGLISGFDDGSFRPSEKITREQAMLILSKAMAIVQLQGIKSGLSASESLQPFTDAGLVSQWAMNGAADSVNAGIVSGRENDVLAPKAFITRAEAAMMMHLLLQKSDLINK